MTVARTTWAFCAASCASAAKAEIDRAACKRAAEILGLDPLLERYPRQLSGGQRQRVAMGRAIVRDPQVFLFDEPLSNLDAKLRVQMRAEIKELHQRLKTTTVYVTHDQIEAMTMADKIVVMHDGIVEQIGAPLELYDHPANLFVAGFIGIAMPRRTCFQGVIRQRARIARRFEARGLARACRSAAGAGQRADGARQAIYGVRPEHLLLDSGGPVEDRGARSSSRPGSETVARGAARPGRRSSALFDASACCARQPGERLTRSTPDPASVHHDKRRLRPAPAIVALAAN